MTRGESDAITAVVTLDESTPPEQILHRRSARAEPGLAVSCRIEASLSASPYEIEIDKKGWIERSLLTTNTARWSWFITPKVGGTHTLVLNIRPIVRLRQLAGRSDQNRASSDLAGEDLVSQDLVSAEYSDVQQYETTVHVKVPWTERPQEAMSRLSATFKVAEGMVRAVTLLLVATLALGGALGIRRRRKRRRKRAS
jgi:hypothetical protein